MRLKVGDQVLVLQGRDKGKKGRIEQILAKNAQVLVSGVNIYKKHAKKAGKAAGGIIDVTKPLPVSKVALICPKCNLATRIQIVLSDSGKVRVCKKCKQQI